MATTAKKLPSGSWRARVFSHYETVTYPDGTVTKKRQYKSFVVSDPTAKGKRQAEKLAAEFLYNRDKLKESEEFSEVSNLTFKAALDTYIAERSEILSPATIRKYRTQQRGNLAYFDDYYIEEITMDDIQRYVNLLSKTKAPKTVRDAYGLIKAVILRFIPDSTIRVTLPKLLPSDVYIPTDNEIKKLISTIEGTKMEIPVYLAAFGGMRRSEISALRVNDIKGCVAHVHQATVLSVENEWKKKSPKSYAGDRYVTLPQFLVDKIDKNKEFVTDLKPNQISSAFTHVLNQAQLSGFTFHTLRHYNASIQHALGIPDAYIMQNNGWGSDKTLKSIYRHALADQKNTNDNVAMQHFNEMYVTKYVTTKNE